MRQGSVLGPLLFLCYINDPQSLIKSAQTIVYADDLAVVVSATNLDRLKMLLQKDLDSISTWCKFNKLTINTDKTKVLWSYLPRTNTISTTEF